MTQAKEQFSDRLLTGSDAGLKAAVSILRAGGLVAFPTETVYGLGADATSDKGVRRIYEAKGRPRENPLIIHVSDLEMADQYAVLPKAAVAVADIFWPGSLTFLLLAKRNSGLSNIVNSGLPTIAVRMPSNKLAQKLISKLGRPVAGPSANLSGRISATTPEEVLSQLGKRIDAILDDGPTSVGIESTILDMTGNPKILRHGAVSQEDLELVLGPLNDELRPQVLAAPGQMASHYAPRAKVVLNVTHPIEGAIWIGFGICEGCQLNLSCQGNLEEAAHNLFQTMAQADKMTLEDQVIAFAPIPHQGIGRAINDRIVRAAAPRE